MLLGLFSLSTQLQAQSKTTLTGRVTDENNNPIQYAQVQVSGSLLATVTDTDGVFKLVNIPSGKHTLTITHLSFITASVEVLIDATEELTITMADNPHTLPQLYVIDTRDQLFSKTPGSVATLDQVELARLKPVSGNEVFRRVPGLHVVDEEGAGLRVNIGIRGLDPDRSRSVLMLEDGIPVALNPYGEPEMYYTPAMDRMSGVEVLKGSGQILYGPQTVGGVINYITAAPPEEQEFGLKIQGGQGSYVSALGSYGNTVNKTGFQISYLHKRADAVGSVNFVVNDVTAKIKFPLSDKSTLGVKIAAYNEVSNSTYVGITQPMYDAGGNDFDVLAPYDELDITRYLMSFTHNQKIGNEVSLQSNLYGYATTRNWRRQDYAYNTFTDATPNPPPADWTGVVWGDESVPGGAIYMRNRTGNRDRQFEVVGWEQKVQYNASFGSVKNELTAGYRFLYERAYEQRVNGTTATAQSGALVSDEIRTGKAWAIYVLDRISISNKFDITPGLRAEFYSYQREILREASVDLYESAENDIAEVIPGIGFNFRPTSNFNVFSGIHRGYAPPRIKDAIDFTADNPVLKLEAEKSWNMEVGVRAQLQRGLYAEATYFYMDFDNQIIPSSQSVGGPGFGVTNAGRTLHHGVETILNFNSRESVGTAWLLAVDANMTYVNATYNSDRIVSSENVNNNQLPYAPKFTGSFALTVESTFGTGVRITNTYVDDQFTDELNTNTPSNNGRIGKMAKYNLIDVTLYHKLSAINASFNLSAKNLTDERYISTRRPEGIRVGIPRFITLGFEFKF